MPTLSISTETTENIADHTLVGFKLLEAASVHDAKSLYKTVDVHMTDATVHNKGISTILAKKLTGKMKRDKYFVILIQFWVLIGA